MSDLHVRTSNYVSIRKAYLKNVILPVFTRIVRDVIPQEKYFCIGGRFLCLRFYTDRLFDQLIDAFAHLEVTKPVRIDLTVHLWDSVSTHIEFVPPWSNSSYFFEQETDVKSLLPDRFLGVFLQGEESLTVYDQEEKTAYFWVHDAKRLPEWVSAAPLRTLLHWFLSESQIHLVHGAVVARGGNAALLTAKGGSGKSTTALACVRRGMTYLADDYIGIESGPTLIAHSLYNSVKIVMTPGSPEKTTSFLTTLFPSQLASRTTLKAILIPMIARTKRTEIVPAAKTQALLALIPTTLFQLPLAESTKAHTLKQMIAQLPCFLVKLSEDSDEAALVIDTFLTQLEKHS